MDSEDIGYKSPPKSSRFKKGRSGNPKGRRKGARSLQTDLENLMERRLSIRENGEQRQVTGQELVLLKLFQKASSGDTKAIDQIVKLLTKIEAAEASKPETQAISDNDHAIVADFLRRNTPSDKNEDDR